MNDRVLIVLGLNFLVVELLDLSCVLEGFKKLDWIWLILFGLKEGCCVFLLEEEEDDEEDEDEDGFLLLVLELLLFKNVFGFMNIFGFIICDDVLEVLFELLLVDDLDDVLFELEVDVWCFLIFGILLNV